MSHKIIWFFKDDRNVNGIEKGKEDLSLDEAKEFIKNKYNQLKSWGKDVELHHDGKISYSLKKNNFGIDNILCYQIISK